MTSPQMLAAASASIPDAAAPPAREVASLAPRAGTLTRAPGAVPTAAPGARSIMTGLTRDEAAVALQALAQLHINETIGDNAIWDALDGLAGSDEHRWARWQDLREAVRLRDGINDGCVQWDEVDDELTGFDRSEAAHDIACGRVDDAIRALLGGAR